MVYSDGTTMISFQKPKKQILEELYALRQENRELKLSNKAKFNYTARHQIFHNIVKAVLAANTQEKIASITLEQVKKLIPCQRAFIIVFDKNRNQLNVIAEQKNGETEFGKQTSFPLSNYGSIQKLEQGKIDVIEDGTKGKNISPMFQKLMNKGMRSFYSFPLKQGKLIGTLNLACNVPECLLPEHLNIGSEIANLLAVAIHQASLIEELKKSTQELKDTNSELEAFSYTVAHDLRAPLLTIQGFAHHLLLTNADHENSYDNDSIQRILKASNNMNLLIDDLLVYSKLKQTELKNEPVNLVDIIEESIVHLEREIRERGAEISWNDQYPAIQGHQNTLVYVLTNLISNAVKYVASNVKPRVSIYTTSSDSFVRLWIQDNGIGIAEENFERIFQTFKRLHSTEKFPGTGIGLAVVRKGVERMGGLVGVESTPGQGSKFWIELPKAQQD